MAKIPVWRSALVLLCLALLTSVFVLLYAADASIAREHGPMENFQTAWLCAGMLVLAAFSSRGENPGRRCFLSGLALFYLTFALLEFDVRPFRIPWLTLLLNGAVRNGWVGAAWGLVAWWAWRHRQTTLEAARVWLRSFSGVLLALAGAFWIGGALAEKLPWFSGSETFFAEELMEVNAAVLMALAAFSALGALRQSGLVPALDTRDSETTGVRRDEGTLLRHGSK